MDNSINLLCIVLQRLHSYICFMPFRQAPIFIFIFFPMTMTNTNHIARFGILSSCISANKALSSRNQNSLHIYYYSSISSFFTTLAGLPATTVHGGTSFVTTEPAPTIAPSPIVTPFSIIAFIPIQALSLM